MTGGADVGGPTDVRNSGRMTCNSPMPYTSVSISIMAGCGQPPPRAASSAENPVDFRDVSGASDCARQTFGICKGSNMVRYLDHALRSLRAELISDHSVYERPEELAEGVRGRSSNPRV